jgi:hypothetical protein
VNKEFCVTPYVDEGEKGKRAKGQKKNGRYGFLQFWMTMGNAYIITG